MIEYLSSGLNFNVLVAVAAINVKCQRVWRRRLFCMIWTLNMKSKGNWKKFWNWQFLFKRFFVSFFDSFLWYKLLFVFCLKEWDESRLNYSKIWRHWNWTPFNKILTWSNLQFVHYKKAIFCEKVKNVQSSNLDNFFFFFF